VSSKNLIVIIISLFLGLALTILPLFGKTQAQLVSPAGLSEKPPQRLAQTTASSGQFTCIPEATVTTDYPAGKISYCRQKSFPQAVNDSARVDIKPGASRTPHWHDTWEQQFLISGQAKLYLIDPQGKLYTETMTPGTISVIPSGWTH
jgi:oxalate decarboxylase/phosphoglucose isomerase-like protein (cupin superfamily)